MAKRHHRKKSSSVRAGELAPKEFLQHNKIALETIDRDANGRAYIKRQRVLDECRLDGYLQRSLVTVPEHEAGMKFRCAYLRAVFHIKTLDAGANPFLNDAGGANAEAAILARMGCEELLRKVYTLLSTSQKEIVIAVCGHDEFAGTTAKRETLKRALNKMARYWGLT